MTHKRAAASLLTLALLVVGITPSPGGPCGVRCSGPGPDTPTAAPSPERLTTLATASQAAGDWRIVTVPSSSDQGTFSSIAVDQTGAPYISFLDQDTMEVRYAVRLAEDAWEEQIVDTLTFLAWSNTSLALDEEDQPQIAYPFANPCRIGHAAQSGATWQVTKLDPGGCPEYVNLALDGAGEPCISYHQWERRGETKIHVLCREGGVWQTASAVDTVNQTALEELALYHDLVLESDGTPHLSYYRQTTDTAKAELWYATRSDGAWERTVVDAGPGVGSYSSLALDSQTRPAISYYDHVDGDLRYARWDGSRWISETVDSGGDVGAHTSLALDGGDRPHVSYHDATNQDLKYAAWDGSRWISETVASDGAVGQWTSLALDNLGNPHISAYDATNGDLLYATRDTSPEADFSAQPTSGPAPLTVDFTNLSSGDYDACTWSFGDGDTSSDCADPSHVYTSAAAYTVTLSVSGPGGSDVRTRPAYVKVRSIVYLPAVLRGG